MRNLFVCHTQAQLTLACGLCRGRFRNEENDLILFVDFDLKEVMKIRLEKVFTRTLFLQSIYPAEYNTYRAKTRWYVDDWKQIKKYVTNPYSRVFVVCDTLLLVQKTMKRAYFLNCNTHFIWLEDGILAYYQNVDFSKGFDRDGATRLIRKIIIKYLCGVGKFYDRDFPGFGGTARIREVYALFPDAVREPYRSLRQITGIADEEYQLGLRALYEPSDLDLDDNSTLLLLDKLDTYIYPDTVKAALKKLIDDDLRNGKTVYCKLHPRETIHWEIFDTCKVLDRSIGVEGMYLSLIDRNKTVSVVGIKSAGLMSARKLGFDTASLFLLCGETNADLIRFFTTMHIKMIRK